MTTPPDVFSVANICQQRARGRLLRIPPSRFTPVNPYPQFTQFQLNMRRKAEILTYSNTQSNGKTNNLTKAQQYARVISGSTRLNVTNANNNGCPVDKYRPTPSSSSDVPGGLMLYQDPAVPLYRFQSDQTRSYGIENEANPTEPWQTFTMNDISMSSSTHWFTLLYTNVTPIGYDIYNVSTPISFVLRSLQPTTPIQSSVVFTVSTIYVDVFYNDILMATNDMTKISSAKSSTPIKLSTNDTQAGFDAPFHIQFATTSNNIRATFYAGIIHIYSLMLFANPGFIYDVVWRPVFTFSPAQPTIEATMIVNTTSTRTETTGCTISNAPSADPYQPFQFLAGEYTTTPTPVLNLSQH